MIVALPIQIGNLRTATMKFSVDPVLFDAQMPMKSGFDVCASLKSDEKTRSIPIMMLTAVAGTASETVRKMRKDLQPDYLVAKPFKIDHVTELVQKLLANPSSSSVA